MTTLWCRQGGLMEDPAFHWERIGEAEGSTLQEVCDNLAAVDPCFAEYYNSEGPSYWGWKLSLYKEEE